jgi:hypothetical protein
VKQNLRGSEMTKLEKINKIKEIIIRAEKNGYGYKKENTNIICKSFGIKEPNRWVTKLIKKMDDIVFNK